MPYTGKNVSGQTKGPIWNDGFHLMHLPLPLKYVKMLMYMWFLFHFAFNYIMSKKKMDLCGINLISYMHTLAARCVLFSTCAAPRPAAPPQTPPTA